MRRRFVTISAIFLALGAVGLAGCGQKASATEIVRSSPHKTEKAKTAKTAVTVQVGGQTVTADGVIDIAGKRGKLAFDTASLGIPGGSADKIEVITAGTTLYMKLPAALVGKVPGGKPFVKIDLQAAGEAQGFDFGALSQTTDTGDQLGYLRGIADDVKAVGTETLRGAKATHYKGTVDLNKAKAGASPDKRRAVDAVVAKLGASTFPVEVWVDGEGRIRKMAYAIDLSKSAAAADDAAAKAGPMNIAIELYDYGTKVEVAEPPADQVSDLTTLISQDKSSG